MLRRFLLRGSPRGGPPDPTALDRGHDAPPTDRPAGAAPPFEPRSDALTAALGDLYAAPDRRLGAGYWDDLEQRVLAAVRRESDPAAGAVDAATARPWRRARPAAVEWWQALARWSSPGLAAAGVLLAVAGAAVLQARAAGRPAPGADVPPLRPLDPDLARLLDMPPAEGSAESDVREATDLLSDGVKRRAPVPLDSIAPGRGATPTDPTRARERARREATFRYVMPE